MKLMSLRLRLTLLLAGLIAIALCAAGHLALWLPAQLQGLVHQAALARGNDVATQLMVQLGPGLQAEDDVATATVLRLLDSVPGADYAVVLRPDGHVLGRWNAGHVPLSALKPPARPEAELDHGRLRVVRDVQEGEQILGSLVLGLDVTALQDKADALCLEGLVLALALAAACVGLRVYVGATLIRPLTVLTQATARIAQTGDLTRPVVLLRSDELGTLASSVATIITQQRSLVTRINSLAVGIAAVAQRVFAAGHGISSGTTQMQGRAIDTAAVARELQGVIDELGREVARLADSSDASAAQLMQMATSNATASSVMKTMTHATGATGDAIEGMARSIGEIAHNIERLNDTISQTSAAVGLMTQNIDEVERTSKETARLSERVSSDADVGVQALQKTLQGIDNIKRASQSAADVIAHLGLRIEEIGAILRVIDEVAAQTKLLSLNAAIIASQAGEHGRGFSVVADQIKQLAQRTGASTREIAALIESVQQESRKAVTAMALGVTSVEDGVLLGHAAADALEKIQLSAGASTAMIHKIAASAVDQARSSKEITQSIARIGQTVAQIGSYSQQQAHGTEQITASSKNMHALNEQMRLATHEQTKTVDQILHAMQSINGVANRLGAAQRTQAQSAGRLHSSVEDIRSICSAQGGSVAELEAAVTALGEEAKSLALEAKKYTA
jgi:methyl-accepting chemotaxis protein